MAGAGPAGATIARLLAAKGRHVVLVDPGHLRMSRLELLAPPALGVIEALGLARNFWTTRFQRHASEFGAHGVHRLPTSKTSYVTLADRALL